MTSPHGKHLYFFHFNKRYSKQTYLNGKPGYTNLDNEANTTRSNGNVLWLYLQFHYQGTTKYGCVADQHAPESASMC